MHQSPNRRQAVLPGIVTWLLLVAAPLLAVDDGTYTGTTSQGKSISITVSGGSVTGFTVGWSCGFSSGSFESFATCSIDAGGAFSCGSSSCTPIPYKLFVQLTGTFSGESVAGSVDMELYPCDIACVCTSCGDVTYTASLPVPEIFIYDISLPEGNSGTSVAEFEVTRTYDDGNTATVDWATSHGTADASDYTPGSGTLTFGPGQFSRTVSVLVTGDTDPEPNEVFYVDLSNATNAAITDPQGKCTIEDDDQSTRQVTILLDGMESMDAYLDVDNYIVHRMLSRGPSLMIGFGWNLNLQTVGDSWLADFKLYFDGADRDGSGLHLTPGPNDQNPGTKTYSSPVVYLGDVGIADIPILDDGKIYIELYEAYDDYPGSVDGTYEMPSEVTVEHTVAPIFSDGFESGDVSAWSASVP